MNGVGDSPHIVVPSLPLKPCFQDVLAEGEAEGNACALLPDVDEAAHAGFAMLKNGGLHAFHQHAHQQMNLALHHQLGASFAYDPLAKGAAGLLGTVAGAGLVGPAAGFAMHAGWHEWSEAKQDAKQFKDRAEVLSEEASLTPKLSLKCREDLGKLTASFDQAAALRLAENTKFAMASKSSGLIGKYSFLSGAAIMGRIGFELVRNVGGAAASGTYNVADAVAQGTLPPSFLMGTGLASNALATVASGFAVMLGVHFVRKTKAAFEPWKTDISSMTARRHLLMHSASPYGKFLAAKSNHRLQFMKSFHWKNNMFLAGASMYAAGAILPSCVKMLASVGILSSKKVGTKLILDLFYAGVAGAAVMGIFSHQFLFGHPNLERYEQYGWKDSKELDRRFLANIDSFVFKNNGKELDLHYSVRQGLEMRQATFMMLQENNMTRESLLQHIAKDAHCKYMQLGHVEDENYRSHRPCITKVKIFFSKKRLRTQDVKQWLLTMDNKKHLLRSFGKMMSANVAYFQRKADLHLRMHNQVMDGAQSLTHEEIDQRQKYCQAMIGSHFETQALLKTYQDMSQKIAVAHSPSEIVDALIKVMELQAPEEQEGTKHKGSFEDKLAQHVFQYLPARYNHDRGKLLEIERQAGKMHAFKPASHI